MVFAVSELKSAQKNCSFHQKLQFLDQNLQLSSKSAVFIKNHRFSTKSAVFIKIYGFCQNPVSVKSVGFIKFHGFHQNLQFSSKTMDFHENLQSLPFLSELLRGQHQIGILCKMKDHLPRKVTPFYSLFVVALEFIEIIKSGMWKHFSFNEVFFLEV